MKKSQLFIYGSLIKKILISRKSGITCLIELPSTRGEADLEVFVILSDKVLYIVK